MVKKLLGLFAFAAALLSPVAVAQNTTYRTQNGTVLGSATDPADGARVTRTKCINCLPDILPVVVTGRASIGDLTASVETTGYRTTTWQAGGTWSGNVFNQQSNDNINWSNINCVRSLDSTWATSIGYQPNQILTCPIVGRYMKWVIPASNWFSGTITGTAFLRAANLDLASNTVTASIPASISNFKSMYYNDATNAAFTAGQVTQVPRDTAVNASPFVYSTFGCFVRSDQPGTLNMQFSADNVNYVTASSTATVAGTAYTISSPVFYRYNRCQFTNGATPSTSTYVASNFSS